MSGFSNPIAGASGSLTIPQLQSPDFVSGVSGWRISKNGDAEFNNVETRGSFFGFEFIINDSGAFFYSGTPAAGNLIASIASTAGSDQFLNAYLPGINVYGSNGAVATLDTNSGNPALHLLPPMMAHVLVHPEIFAFSTSPGAAAESVWLTFTSGKESGAGSGADAGLQLISEAADGSSPARVVFEFGGTVAGTWTLAGGLANGSWTQATLSNSWAGSGSGVNGLFYRLTADNEVEILFDIRHATATGNSVCATLPVTLAASGNQAAAWNNPVTSNAASVPWIFIGTNGVVQITGIEAANKPIFGRAKFPIGAL